MMSPGGKLTVLACNPTKKVNNAEELTYLSTNIESLSDQMFVDVPVNVDYRSWLTLIIRHLNYTFKSSTLLISMA
jgi:hypothetical protein